jgi:hypothetical protein
MAILELVVNQKYYNQLVINRFHYVQSGTPAAVTPSFALTFATGFAPATGSPPTFESDTLADYFKGSVSLQLQFISVFSRNLYSATDFYEVPYPVPVVGGQTGEAASPALAYGLFSNRVRTDVRRGQKRLSGVTETLVDAGGVVSAGQVAGLASLCGKMSDILTYDDEGNTLSFTPCVLGLDEYTTDKGNTAYRVFPTESEQLSHTAQGISWQPYTTVRTQVSRQYGRGV